MRRFSFSLFAALFLSAASTWAQNCDAPAVIAFETSVWGQEISWSFQDESGQIIATGEGYGNYFSTVVDVCLGTGCHTLTLVDSYGDGWNGAQWTLIDAAGQSFGPYTLATGSFAVLDVPVVGTCGADWAGCMDPAALNYSPNAVSDDGSCFYEGDCAGCENDLSDPVCALNPATGEITMYPGACWALCDGAVVLDAWDCTQASSGGCTDPLAGNYNPTATFDDGSCTYPCAEGETPASLYLCTFSNGAQVALEIMHESGEVVYSQSGFGNGAIVYVDLCLEPGCYSANLSNNSGNTGWFNGYFSLNGAGVSLYNITLPDGSTSATYDFSVDGSCGSTPGCTDPDAPNFDPAASWDDGSCLPSCNCDEEAYEPVCAWDWSIGAYVTLNNLCEAACYGWNIAWYGECSEQPIYGCMDDNALNFNPEATVNETCIYAPICAEGQIPVEIAVTSTNPSPDYPAYFYLSNPTSNTFPNVVSYTLDGTTYGVGCLAADCYNFFLYETWSGEGLTATAVADGDTTVFELETGMYSGTFGWGVGIDEPCTYQIGGCMDPEALNFNPTATFDNGSCSYPLLCDSGIVSTVYVCTFSNGQAVGLNITADDGTVLFDQQGFSDMAIVYVDVCLDPNACYVVTMTNNDGSYGWYGGYYWVDAQGIQIGGGELPYYLTEATETFGWFGACADGIGGCMDPNASNYNPGATYDDGSCTYPSACTTGQEVNFMVLAMADAWFEISDSSGSVWSEGTTQGGAWTATACLEDGCYNFHLERLDGGSLQGSFASMTLEDGTMLSMVADDEPMMDEGFGIGSECGGNGFTEPGGSPWEFDETIAFTPYPNPTETIVNVAGNGWDQHFPVDVTVRDLAGKVVLRMRIPSGVSPRFNVEEWPAGMYLIQLEQDGKSGQAPFMKVR